jgi:hypothetical protein
MIYIISYLELRLREVIAIQYPEDTAYIGKPSLRAAAR